MVYDNIKKICDERGMTIACLERKAKLGNGIIAGWKQYSPTASRLARVADALGVPVDSLLTEDDREDRRHKAV